MKVDNFGILFDLYPGAIENNLAKDGIDRHIDTLVSFFVRRPNWKGRFDLIGSGFFTPSEDPTVVIIVTANHVLEEFERHGFGCIGIEHLIMPVDNVGTIERSIANDAAFWLVPSDVLIRHGLKSIVGLPLLDERKAREAFTPMDSFLIMGIKSVRERD